MSMRFGLTGSWAGALALACGVSTVSAAGLEVVGTAYRPDVPFPRFLTLWAENWALRDANGEPLQYPGKDAPGGGYLHIYLRNSSNRPVEITDLALESVSLTEAIAFLPERQVSGMSPASIRFSKLPEAEIKRLISAGEPVWWKADPWLVPPEGAAEVALRLRRAAPTPAANLAVLAGGDRIDVKVPTTRPSPRFAGISFSPDLQGACLHVRHTSRDARPERVLVDGVDVTARSQILHDPALDVAVIAATFEQPAQRGSFHLFQVAYSDGSAALAGVRAWSDEFVYGMWGYINQGETPRERVDYYLTDMRRHHINALMQSYGGEVGQFLQSPEGVEYRARNGLRVMVNGPGKLPDPLYYFLTDEPDAHDYAVKELDPMSRLAALGQPLVRRAREFRQASPATPQLLNVDNTYKPDNWYTYGQLADVYCADPYYQEQQRIVWNDRPAWASAFVKPTYVLGVTTICQSACAPRPLHIILNSVRHDSPKGPFRFATPTEKRVEVFYALSAGAKGLSYWWYTPYGEFHGCGSSDPAGVALWTEIGRLGALTRTAGPLIVRSCPAETPVKSPLKLWTRTLLSGSDALLLLAVNENIASDRQGTVVVPLEKADLTLTPPAWLAVADVFEVSEQGVQDVAWRQEGTQLALSLGRVEVARMIVVTADRRLREVLARLHREDSAQTLPAPPVQEPSAPQRGRPD